MIERLSSVWKGDLALFFCAGEKKEELGKGLNQWRWSSKPIGRSDKPMRDGYTLHGIYFSKYTLFPSTFTKDDYGKKKNQLEADELFRFNPPIIRFTTSKAATGILVPLIKY